MIQTFIYKLLQRRHFWRYATFGEVAEIYASRTMRLFALRIVTTFTSIYLYQEGYSLIFLAYFWAAFYGIKVLFAWPSAQLIARFGPKHATLVSNIVSAVGMTFLPLVPIYGLKALVPWLILQAFSSCLNDLAYLVDFSKVKNIEHAGKEIGYMNIFEKVATGVSPLVGGMLAFFFGPEVVMILSAALFLLAAVPLFHTGEPTHTHQKLAIRGFPWRTTWRSLIAEASIGYDVFVTGSAWTLFMVVAIFVNNGDEIYAKVGVLTSITIVAALLSSYTFGRIIDHSRGGDLLTVSVILNGITHLFRPFVIGPIGVAAVNSVNEAATTGYAMAFIRGMFDTADASGRRIVYLFFMEVATNFGAMFGGVLLALIFMVVNGVLALQIFFIISGFIVLLIGTPRFMLYRK